MLQVYLLINAPLPARSVQSTYIQVQETRRGLRWAPAILGSGAPHRRAHHGAEEALATGSAGAGGNVVPAPTDGCGEAGRQGPTLSRGVSELWVKEQNP